VSTDGSRRTETRIPGIGVSFPPDPNGESSMSRNGPPRELRGLRRLRRWGVRVALVLGVLGGGLEAPAAAQSYGYEKDQDPLVLGVKKAISAARKEDWSEVRATIATLEWQVEELRHDVRVEMKPVLDRAIETEDAQHIGYALTQLVFQSLRQKLHWNNAEKLEHHARARMRLQAARFYYEEILSHTVRRADRARKEKRHEEILATFDELRRALGSPGLFGAGKADPKPEVFSHLSEKLEKSLREVYPDFLGAKKEDEKPSSRPEKREGDKGSTGTPSDGPPGGGGR
ncbi:MAG: hypothetical protein KDC38_10095, partial [Planctomycetes bacterium]|nr:hypothetical protein [Planctomycetota bacterium]